MNIKFEKKSDQLIWILNADESHGNPIGQIFTPSGTMHDTPSCIQICGFDKAFDLWGCGIFSDDQGNAKQDIQLLFNMNSCKGKSNDYTGIGDNGCSKCFHHKDKCQCDKLKLYSEKEIIAEAIIGDKNEKCKY